jgi:hypothetical protein
LPEALEDVQRLRLFLVDKNPTAAVRSGRVLQDGAKLLASFPEAGYSMNEALIAASCSFPLAQVVMCCVTSSMGKRRLLFVSGMSGENRKEH